MLFETTQDIYRCTYKLEFVLWYELNFLPILIPQMAHILASASNADFLFFHTLPMIQAGCLPFYFSQVFSKIIQLNFCWYLLKKRITFFFLKNYSGEAPWEQN